MSMLDDLPKIPQLPLNQLEQAFQLLAEEKPPPVQGPLSHLSPEEWALLECLLVSLLLERQFSPVH